MPQRQRHVDIARLADRFAVVQHFEDGKEAAVFLQEPGQRIEIPRTAMSAKFRPLGLRFAGSLDGGVHIRLRGLAQGCKHLTRCGVAAVKTIARFGKGTVNEMAKTVALIHKPRQRIGGGFRGFAIVHGLEYVGNGHDVALSLSRGDTRRSNCRLCGVPVGVRCH